MTHYRIGFLVALSICVAASAGFAQTGQAPAKADRPVAKHSAAHAKKHVHKKTSSALSGLQPAPEDAEKAARLNEGRKKFFEQSTGFDNSDTDAPGSVGGSGGFTPGIGLKF